MIGKILYAARLENVDWQYCQHIRAQSVMVEMLMIASKEALYQSLIEMITINTR